MIKVLVCGGRGYDDWLFFKKEMTDIINPLSKYEEAFYDVVIIQGGASGADFMAKMWAQEHNCLWKDHEHKADWKRYGKSAGYIRNAQMYQAENPDLVVAFPGGDGTAGMIKIAKKGRTKVIEIV